MGSVTRDTNLRIVDQLYALERRVRALESRRKPEYVGFQVISGSQALALGTNTIDLTSTNIDTGGIVDLTGNKVTLPWEGYYQLFLKIPPASPTGAADSLIYSVTRAAYIAGMNTTLVAEMSYADYIYCQANEELQLRCVTGGATTIGGYRWGMTYHRPVV